METVTDVTRPVYEEPEMVTYAGEEILAQLGPAQAQYSTKPDAGDGGGFI